MAHQGLLLDALFALENNEANAIPSSQPFLSFYNPANISMVNTMQGLSHQGTFVDAFPHQQQQDRNQSLPRDSPFAYDTVPESFPNLRTRPTPSSARDSASYLSPFTHPLSYPFEPSLFTSSYNLQPSQFDSSCGIPVEGEPFIAVSSQEFDPSRYPDVPFARDTKIVDWDHGNHPEASNLISDAVTHKGLYPNATQWPQLLDTRLDSQTWSEMNAFITALDTSPSSQEPSPILPFFPFLETSSDSSPSPSSPNSMRHYSPLSSSPDSSAPSTPLVSRDSSIELSSPTTKPGGKQCSHCRATSTPLWRREPTTLKPLCNACGLYLQQRNKLRPQELIDADTDDDAATDASKNQTGPECSHCHTRQTSVWRRSKTGAQLCNACGVYSRLRGKDRPLSLKRNKIKPRSKHTTR